jgi:phosphate-selective porin OprO/OprP
MKDDRFGATGASRLKAGVALATMLCALGLPAAAFADTASEIAALKAQLKRLESRMAEQAKTNAQVKNALNSAKTEPGIVAPPPVFVSFKNGLFVETEDKAFSFKIGGRIQADGGFGGPASYVDSKGKTQNLFSASNAGFRRAQLEVEGKAYKNWYYKFQYEFTNNGAAGIRDAWFGYRQKLLPEELTKEPVSFQVGNFFEPFGLDAVSSTKHITFLERSLPSALAPSRHIGAAVTIGDKNWALKTGVYSTSPQDTATSPPAGSSQYWDVAVRGIYSPIVQEDALLHVGGSFKYSEPNNTTQLTNAAGLLPGRSTEREETDILGGSGAFIRVPGAGTAASPTWDMNCFLATTNATTGAAANSFPGTGKGCLKSSYSYGFEAATAYGPFSAQAEYIATQYERDGALVAASGAPGGTSLLYSGYYVQGSAFLTGESRAASYNTYAKSWNSPGTFSDVQIKDPLSKGGLGAWEVAARFSELNLQNGGLQGGRAENLTLALNWYPVRGVRFQANWTHVVTLVGPSDRTWLTGQHPDLFLARAQVFW